MADADIESAVVDNDAPTLVAEIQQQAVKRVKAARYRRERKERQSAAEVANGSRSNFNPEVKHELTLFERRFKDDFQTLISRHSRQLKKTFRDAPEAVRNEVLSYAHGYMRRTLLANVPERYRAERLMAAS